MAECGPANGDVAGAAAAAASQSPTGWPRRWERLKLAAVGPWARTVGLAALLGLLYCLRGPLRLRDNLAAGEAGPEGALRRGGGSQAGKKMRDVSQDVCC